MKKSSVLILLIILMTLSACQTTTQDITAKTTAKDSMPTCHIEIGMSYNELYNNFSDRLILNRFNCLVWKNDDGTCDVAIFRNGSNVSALAHFSPDFTDVETCGMSLMTIIEPERFYGKPERDFISEYGEPHIDVGSGRYIPVYISQNGRVYFPMILSENEGIIDGIGELDLATETSRFFDGTKWIRKTGDGLREPN